MNTPLYLNLIIYSIMSILMIIPTNSKHFHPVTMSILLIVYSLFTSINMSMFSSSYLYSFLVFLTFIGGILILFMYFTSLSMNMIMTINFKFLMSLSYKMMLMMWTFMFMKI
uniref:NADH dehydrogenase subunit 6 n=1 Tax=Vanhornia eucnemidarum TaxID=32432 RepID=Q0H2F2_9HYME|nr:NADH dehydrogenase subunit 6 [Vanhornia eucnemidarum]